MAMATPSEKPEIIANPGHMDHLPAREMASVISSALNITVGISSGIHYDAISPDEIRKVFNLCGNLAERIIIDWGPDSLKRTRYD